MDNDLSNWVRDSILRSLDNPIYTLSLIKEKKDRVNNRLYKYCPLSDEQNSVQYSIENLKNSMLYMSRISGFNDPFDTYISFSIDEIIPELVPRIAQDNFSQRFDENTRRFLPLAFELLINNNPKDGQSEKLSNYLIRIIENNPSLLSGNANPETLVKELLTTFITDVGTGTITLQETEAFFEACKDKNKLMANILRVCIENPDTLRKVGIQIDDNNLSDLKNLLSGKNIEIETAKTKYLKQINSIRPELLRAIEQTRRIINEKFYVTCFATNADNALMWAHYANKHKGFCIEYDLSKTNDTSFLINLHPVIYSKDRATVPLSMFDLSNLKNVVVSKSNNSTVDLLCSLLIKSDVWRYENEWRLLLYDEVEKLHENLFSVDCISKVIMGCLINEAFENQLKNICKAKGYRLSKMRLDDVTYKLHEDVVI